MKSINNLILFALFTALLIPSLQAMSPGPKQIKSPESLKELASEVLASKTRFVDQIIDADPKEAREIFNNFLNHALSSEIQEPLKQALVPKVVSQLMNIVPRLEKTIALQKEICKATFTNDGTLALIVAYKNRPTDDQRIELLDLSSGKILKDFPAETNRHPSSLVRAIVFSDDNSQFLVTCNDNTHVDEIVILWDIASGSPCQRFPHNEYVSSAAFNHDNSKILTTSSAARIWDPHSGKCLQEFRGEYSVTSAVFCRHSPHILTTSEDQKITIWNIDTSHCTVVFVHGVSPFIQAMATVDVTDLGAAPSIYVLEVKLSHNDDSHALTIGSDDKVQAWLVSKSKCLQTFDHDNHVYSAKFNHDGSLIITASSDKKARLFTLSSNKCIHELPTNDKVILATGFSQDDSRASTACMNGEIKTWLLPKGILQSISFPAIALLLKIKQYGPHLISSECYKQTYQGLAVAEKEVIDAYVAQESSGVVNTLFNLFRRVKNN